MIYFGSRWYEFHFLYLTSWQRNGSPWWCLCTCQTDGYFRQIVEGRKECAWILTLSRQPPGEHHTSEQAADRFPLLYYWEIFKKWVRLVVLDGAQRWLWSSEMFPLISTSLYWLYKPYQQWKISVVYLVCASWITIALESQSEVFSNFLWKK